MINDAGWWKKRKRKHFFLGAVLIKVSFPEGSDTAAVQSGRDVQLARSVNFSESKKNPASLKKIRILNKTKKRGRYSWIP